MFEAVRHAREPAFSNPCVPRGSSELAMRAFVVGSYEGALLLELTTIKLKPKPSPPGGENPPKWTSRWDCTGTGERFRDGIFSVDTHAREHTGASHPMNGDMPLNNNRPVAIATLKWLVDESRPQPRIDQIDPNYLERMLQAHKISVRFKHRVLTEGVDLPLGLSERIDALVDLEESRIRRLELEFGRIAQLVAEDQAWDESPIVQIKGNSASLNLRAPNIARPSRDIDLIANDPVKLTKVLERNGYQVSHPSICHEESGLGYPGKADIDVHRYFPSWSYMHRVEHPAPSGWLGRTRIISEHLTYEDIVQSAIPHPASMSGLGLIPGPAVTALILCTHVFKDYVEAPIFAEIGQVRLAEVCEFLELFGSPGFDADEFYRLAEKVKARDSLDFMRRVAGDLGASIDLVQPGFLAPRKDFPQEFTRGVLVAGTDSETDELLISDPDKRAAYSGLSGLNVSLPPGATVQLDTRDASVQHGVYRNDPDGVEPLQFEVTLERRDSDLSLTFEVAAHEGHYIDEVLVAIGNRNYRIQRWEGFADLELWPIIDVTWIADKGKWMVNLVVPMDCTGHSVETQTMDAVFHVNHFIRPLSEEWSELFQSSLQSTTIVVTLGGSTR